MSDRSVAKKTYLTPDEAAQLSEWSGETGKSESCLLREAVREYLDHDRTARIEERLDRIEDKIDELDHTAATDTTRTHTAHPPMKQGSNVTERARDIIRRLQSNHDAVIQDDDVVRAIEDIAGADDRTIRKYKNLFRKRGLLYEHPGDTSVWTLDTDQWTDWVRSYCQLNGTDATADALDPYPADVTLVEGGSYRIELAGVSQ